MAEVPDVCVLRVGLSPPERANVIIGKAWPTAPRKPRPASPGNALLKFTRGFHIRLYVSKLAVFIAKDLKVLGVRVGLGGPLLCKEGKNWPLRSGHQLWDAWNNVIRHAGTLLQGRTLQLKALAGSRISSLLWEV